MDTILVIGGGIAGCTCAVEALRLSPSSNVTLVSPSPTLRTVEAIEHVTPLLGIVHVGDRSSDDFAAEHGVRMICDEVVALDHVRSQAQLASGGILTFSRCCVATGASPALVAQATPRYFGIRDTESVENLRERLVDAKRVLVVGNGGLALELVHFLASTQACQVVWAVRNSYIGNTFFDASASAFFVQHVSTETTCSRSEPSAKTGTPTGVSDEKSIPKASVGPDWLKTLATQAGTSEEDRNTTSQNPLLDIQFECELGGICERGEDSSDLYPVSATLTNGRRVECDFVVSATGVRPNTGIISSDFKRGPDGGLCVDEMMRVVRCGGGIEKEGDVENNIFAAGDCCCLERNEDHWFQIRLWRQARDMGLYAAKCITGSLDELSRGGVFELFVHATRFFGFKVALLGRFNGQGLGPSVQDLISNHELQEGPSGIGVKHGVTSTPECRHESIHIKRATSESIRILIRTTPGVEYVKVVLVGGRVRGAMLVGDTGLEETFENLILSETDISHIGDNLLTREVDIEDFFD
ncbi:conserved unknown protein [Ectocarpus siliculosus]|uniref:FAD/NAD(P)-binding domain-containing protein n=1 Tax=Ectocarpus siliculosus TaxID=2880 RepID=D7G908_ECTSI|nr:conserved unknown protein [Ectocarpus siliculosus]|eukprot:CBJ28169.1 conserved unknown protein [Ectocarpus siliculosus]